jgi:hypothetical protein
MVREWSRLSTNARENGSQVQRHAQPKRLG